MMTNPMARLRQSGSFIAGLLIGLSMAVFTFAATDADPGPGELALLFFGAPVVLVLGLALQVVVTRNPRHRRATRA
jgi:hypothetical protein